MGVTPPGIHIRYPNMPTMQRPVSGDYQVSAYSVACKLKLLTTADGGLHDPMPAPLEIGHSAFGESRTSDAGAFACDLILRDRSIDAYFAGNDSLAVQVLFELQRAGIRVPEDVAICGFDGIGWGQMINPRLTTLKQPLEFIASTALDIISNPGAERREAILPVEFLRGQTT